MAKNDESQTPELTKEELAAQLEEAKAQLEQMEALRAERDELAAVAKAAEEKLAAQMTTPSNMAEADEEMTTVMLFKDNERYKDDVFVAVNGRRFQIQRGVPVQVPRYVAAVLEQSRAQDMATSRMMDQKAAEFEQAAKALDI